MDTLDLKTGNKVHCVALNSRCQEQQTAAAPPPTFFQIKLTDFLTFVVAHACN